jgi:hypothetical protein
MLGTISWTGDKSLETLCTCSVQYNTETRPHLSCPEQEPKFIFVTTFFWWKDTCFRLIPYISRWWWGGRFQATRWLCAHQLSVKLTELMCLIVSIQGRLPKEHSLSFGTLLAYCVPTPWSRVHLEKLIAPQLEKKFPTFYGTRRFITVFIRAHHWSLSWASGVQSPRHTSRYYRPNIILRSMPMYSTWSFPFGFSDWNFVCISLISCTCYMPLSSHPAEPWCL